LGEILLWEKASWWVSNNPRIKKRINKNFVFIYLIRLEVGSDIQIPHSTIRIPQLNLFISHSPFENKCSFMGTLIKGSGFCGCVWILE
jgi:hypothetical protein